MFACATQLFNLNSISYKDKYVWSIKISKEVISTEADTDYFWGERGTCDPEEAHRELLHTATGFPCTSLRGATHTNPGSPSPGGSIPLTEW